MAGLNRRRWGAAPLAFAWVVAAALGAWLTGCSAATDADAVAKSPSPTNHFEEVPTDPGTSPGPTPTMPPEWCEPADFPRRSLPEATLPARGDHLILQLDPCLTVKSLLGSYSWLESQLIDADLIQGFRNVAGIEPWIAPLADGTGRCILIRADTRNGWREIVCDAPDTPATVERTVDGSALQFRIENDAIAVYATPP
ncbi:hypothetical protein R8Z57_05380 [Microbacterium sp. M3]|uniref:Uncharacterized protein n=1 Tax=Microbacterium arthrosphaerae TaxID=792652 RepID=A0ABU4H2S2_9MICO|nr:MULTISPECIES: hypothetical protein [Microbacterium]MDW4572209.1 hypothetical protein [Microbacterium arthrosphaerae]MDW7606064.1 hypothetical protein [Microbacterium sp. M3]